MTTQPLLRTLAGKYIWWLPPDEAIRSPLRLVAQVMNLGTWDDVAALEANVPRAELEQALRHAQPGWFSGPSWILWHLRLGLATPNAVPPLPRRAFA